MARPQVKEPKQQYTVMLKPSVVKELDRIADKFGITRSQFISNVVDAGLDEAKSLEKLGILRTVHVGNKILQKFKKALFSGKVSLDKDGDLEIKK